MTRSIFDPTGRETEHSGSQNLGPDAGEISHLPPGLADREADCHGDNELVDLGPLQPKKAIPPETADAPQESEVMDDPQSLI